MPLARKIIFYLFVFVYLILCPIIILYSLGYIYQPEKGDISRTGLIHIDSTPSGARVYLEKSRFKSKTPATITGLHPGEYQISLRLKDHRPWTHRTGIEPGKSVAFKNVLLLPKKLNSGNLSPGMTYDQLFPQKEADYFIVQKGPKIKDLRIYDRREVTFRALTGKGTDHDDLAVNSVFTADQSGLIILYGGSLWNKKYFLINLEAKEPSLTDISKLLPEPPRSIVWDRAIPKNVFALYDNHVNRLDIQNVSVYPQYFDNIKGFGLSDKWVYLLGSDHVITRSTLEKEQELTLFEDEHLGEDLFKRSRFYDIRKLDREMLLFWGERGDLIATMPPYRLSDGGVLGMAYNEPANRLLYWTKNGIWTVDFDKNDENGLLFRVRARRNDVYRDGVNIGQCFWANDAAHVLFRDKNNVSLLELISDGKHHKEHLVSVKAGSEILYNETDGTLYYLGLEGDLRKISLLPTEKTVSEPLTDEKNRSLRP